MLSQRGMICCSWVRYHRLRGRYAPILFSSCALVCSRAAFQVSCDYLLLCGAIDSCVVVCFVVFDWFIHPPDSLLGSHAKHYPEGYTVSLCFQITTYFYFSKCNRTTKIQKYDERLQRGLGKRWADWVLSWYYCKLYESDPRDGNNIRVLREEQANVCPCI